ncbi:MAG: hypothetical protein HY784_12900 [Chloroflexi bacterium]|nr:hypothetical protein [Chloroflexota bacterium]
MGKYAPRESTLKAKTVNPIWRGVGCLILVLLTVGGYWLAGYLIGLNLVPLPTDIDIHLGKSLTVPGRLVLQVMATAFLDILAYGVMVVVWAIINPPKKSPLDAPPVRPRGGGSLPR